VEHPLTHIKFPALQTNLPVLLLSDLDPAWSQADIDMALEVGEVLLKAIQAAGHPLVLVHLQDGNLADLLVDFNPHELVVFNWCEDVPGIPRSSWMVARELERQGFTFTGADSPALIFSQDKRLVQQRLQEACIPTPIWRVFDSASQVDWHLFPAIVKPAFEHCSLGIERESVVLSEAELDPSRRLRCRNLPAACPGGRVHRWARVSCGGGRQPGSPDAAPGGDRLLDL
jgi:D-alanine-D-alanine ligase